MSLSRVARAVGSAALSSAALAAMLAWPHPALAATCDPATSAVGAHLSHTRDSRAHLAFSCTECHAPACTAGPGSNVYFGPLASKGGATPTWNATTRACSSVYCHGSTLASPPASPPTWAYVDITVPKPVETECAMCHGYPPPSHGAYGVGPSGCNGCHPNTVRADGTIDLAGGKHINGALDVSGGSCTSCHGYPPATGAHLAHFGLTDASGGYNDLRTLQDRYPDATPTTAPAVYAFGCANCHPLDMAANHRNGTADVELYAAAAPAGSLKALAAPIAAYNRADGTCSGVYCHSTGQQGPSYVVTPAWTSGAKVGCAGCHSNPPAYRSGGAATATANSHLNLADDGYEFGHFLGMPGAWHTSKHGGNWAPGQDATPITCQTCHYDTTDPSNTGPSGFYYLDTTGNYRLPGGNLYRIGSGWQDGIQCGFCHNEAGAAQGTGRVLPLRHVNGVRDVAFDPRTTLPPIPWLPAAPNTPTRPYWVTDPGLAGYWPEGLTWNGTTLSFGLDASTYYPATKTCTNVACHVAEQAPVWGRPYQYYTNSSATCYTCHPM